MRSVFLILCSLGLLVEVASFAIFNHLEVLVVEFACLEVCNGVPLCLIFVFQRLLCLLIEPLKDGWIIV